MGSALSCPCPRPIPDPWAERTLYLVLRTETGEQSALVRQFADILLNDPLVVEARARD